MITLKNVSKWYGHFQVLTDCSTEVKKGEVVVVCGPSGSGKSTLIKTVNGLEPVQQGEITVDGIVVNDKKTDLAKLRSRVGMVFQHFELFPHLSIIENLTLAQVKVLKRNKAPAREKALKLLERVGLSAHANKFPAQLSGGQQQRVALARALVMRPGLLLLDEPLSNLDAKLRESMRFEISSIQKELGITVIYVTHDQSEAMTMSDRVVVMSRGVIQQIGTPYEIYRNPANKMVADFIGLVNFVEGEVQGDRVYISGTGVSFPNTSGITGSATIAVRPENITMSRTSGTIEGTLVHRFYLGDAVDYRVQCKHHVIRVIVKGAELKEFTDGEKVYLDFDKIMVFDRD